MYEKQNFVSGQVLKAEHMNHIEDGIVNCEQVLIVDITYPGNKLSHSYEEIVEAINNEKTIICRYISSDMITYYNLLFKNSSIIQFYSIYEGVQGRDTAFRILTIDSRGNKIFYSVPLDTSTSSTSAPNTFYVYKRDWEYFSNVSYSQLVTMYENHVGEEYSYLYGNFIDFDNGGISDLLTFSYHEDGQIRFLFESTTNNPHADELIFYEDGSIEFISADDTIGGGE